MGENKVPIANAHFLSAFLCQIEFPVSGDKKQMSEPFLSHPVVKAYLESHLGDSSVTNSYLEIARLNSEQCLSNLIDDLQLSGNVENVLLGPSAQSVLKNQIPSFLILLSKDLDRKLINQLVKIPDILSNRFYGQLPEGFEVEKMVEHILKNIFDCHCVHQVARESNIKLPVRVLAYCVGTAVTNYSVYERPMHTYIQGLCRLAENESAVLGFADLIAVMTPSHQTSLIKSLFRHSNSGVQVYEVLRGVKPIEELRPVFVQLLFSRTSFSRPEIFARLICYLSVGLEPDHFVKKVFVPVLSLWADPIIARAHVKAEVVHYSKLIFLILAHLSKDNVLRSQGAIVNQIVQGLPNHFSSTDPRTITLAKFICEMITETLKVYEGRSDNVPESIQRPSDELCQEILGSFHDCKTSSQFWYSKVWQSRKNEANESAHISDATDVIVTSQVSNVVDEDDDSDLDPIDTLDVPSKSKVVYIRDFLEGLPEWKTFDEAKCGFESLPWIVRHQLSYEHPQIGRDLLDAVFGWENVFESPEFDELRRNNLCVTLKTKMEGNIDHFCSYFHQSTLQVHKKNLILNVLTHVAQEVNLKDLEILAKVSFREILRDSDVIERQDTINKIPMILFFQKLLCTLPHQMIKEEMVSLFLMALTQMNSMDGAIRQTITYALHNLMTSLEGVPITQGIHSSIVDTRTWLWSLQD